MSLHSQTVAARLRSRLDDYQSKDCLRYDNPSAVLQIEQMDLCMTRLPRLSLPSIPQHVIQRGNNRQACFHADEDYRFYLECLGEAARKYRVLRTRLCVGSGQRGQNRLIGCQTEIKTGLRTFPRMNQTSDPFDSLLWRGIGSKRSTVMDALAGGCRGHLSSDQGAR